jgi:hypothetical protein
MNTLQEIAQHCSGVVSRKLRSGAMSFTFPANDVRIRTVKDGIEVFEPMTHPVTVVSASRAAQTERQRKLLDLTLIEGVTFWTMPDLLWALKLPPSFKNQVGMDLRSLGFAQRDIEYLYDERLKKLLSYPTVYSPEPMPRSMSASFIRKKRREESKMRSELLQKARASTQRH